MSDAKRTCEPTPDDDGTIVVDCTLHMRTEVWHFGRLVGWCNDEVPPEARRIWWRRMMGDR